MSLVPPTLRRAAELLSRGVVVRRRLPDDFARQTVFVSPESALKFWRLDMASVVPELLDFARAHVRPGQRVWDIGANLGLFAIAASMKAGAEGLVVAVEPDPQMLSVLRRSVLALPPEAAPVRAIAAAVTDHTGLAQLGVSRRGRSSNFLAGLKGSETSGGVRERLDVVALTLDALMDAVGPPDVVKIDVETAELLVLRGATRVLSEARPVLLIEVEPALQEEVTALLHGHGYRLHDWDVRGSTPLARAAFNTLALPPRP
jgi:FkbM family methyltransferase